MRTFDAFVVVHSDGCYEWIGPTKGRGYGQWDGDYAHRVAYAYAYGAIPAGQHIHHRCENKLCVRPNHLEAVTPKTHSERHMKDKCAKGHALTLENLYLEPKTGARHCRICRLDTRRRFSGWEGGIPNAAKTHCVHGHPLSGENLRIDRHGKRRCKLCAVARREKWAATNAGKLTLRRIDRHYRERRASKVVKLVEGQ